MSADPLPRLDRRHQRRAQTIDELIAVAVEVMDEQGAAGLSLGEVARRMGVRPPSLYGYIESKNAVYDAVFAQGYRELLAVLRALGEPTEGSDLEAYAYAFSETYVRWSVEHPVHTQLMAWRPVPGYEPSPAAYAVAVEALDHGRRMLARMQDLGGVRADVDLEELLLLWTVVISGVVTQQLANAPQEPYETGSFTRLVPQLVAMYLATYGERRDASSSIDRRTP